MANTKRPRFVSECSTSSSDSYCLDISGDPNYEEVLRGSDEVLIQQKPSRKTKAGNSSSSKIAVVALVLSIVCLLVILSCGGFLGYAYVFKSPFGLPAASKNEEVCMPCDQISPNPLEDAESPNLQQLEIKDGSLDGESKICCARTPAQYAALFKLILKRQEEVKKLADVLGSRGQDVDGEFGGGGDGSSVGSPAVSAVSAHLLTKPMAPQVTDEDGNVLQQWKSPSESPVSHVRQGLKFHDSKIYVQSAGLYFVYCQILYNRATGDHRDYPALASNYVKRHSVLYPASSGILLKARHTRMSGENDRHSSYVGGLFFLHAGDQLFVQVAVPELVSHDDKASFFGLFKVGN